MNNIPVVLASLLFVFLAGRLLWVEEKFDRERMSHDLTRAVLEGCRENLTQMEDRAKALQKALEEAHAREAVWAEEDAARAEIVKRANPGPRPQAERDQVVDDATRRDAMDRLNMDW